VLTLGAAAVLGALALDRNNQALATSCSDHVCTDPRGLALSNDARAFAQISTGFFIVGAATIAAGVVVLLTANDAATRPLPRGAFGFAPAFGPGGGGAGLSGRF
jgi:hypothetical protein